MSDKIKYLTIVNKMPKKADQESFAKTAQYFAPDMYELLYAVSGKDADKKVSELQPEIVCFTSRTVKNGLKKGLQYDFFEKQAEYFKNSPILCPAQ